MRRVRGLTSRNSGTPSAGLKPAESARDERAAPNRPQLYDSSLIPTGEIKGVDSNGELIIQLKHGNAK